MEAHLAPKPSVQVNKIASSCEIYSGPHDTQFCMKNPEQAFVDYASSRNNEVGGKSFTINEEPRYFNEATNSWKDKPNFNWAQTQTFTSPSNSSFSTYSSNVPYGPSNYQTKIERVLCDFDSHQENRLSSLGTQLKQRQDEVINKINTLWKGTSPQGDYQGSVKIIFSQSSLREQNGNSSSLKHVHFLNTITIIRKEDEPKETQILEPNAIESDDRNVAVKDEKTVEKDPRASKVIVGKEDPSDLGDINKASDLEDERNMSHVMDFTVLENVEANIDPSLSQVVFGRPFVETTKLILDRERGLITFTDGIKEVTFKTPYRDPEMDDLTSEGHDLLSSRVILSDDDFRRGCESPLDLENGFYKDIDKLGPLYN
ncbi:hypothetical protein Tco_0053316 [Tanacetum coccineum]